jgi:hypothetical protein
MFLNLKSVFLGFLLCGTILNLNAQWRVPKYSNEFLAIGTGAAGMSMSGAQTAWVKDVTAGYWNPAGLADLEKKTEIGLMHASYFGGIANYDYAAAATKVDSQSVLSFSYIRFGVDDIPDTRLLIDNGQVDYRRISTFSSVDNAFLFGYGRKNVGFKGLSVGGTFKVIYRKAGKFANAWGFGLDAGCRYTYRKWKLALMARDVTTTFNAWTYNVTELEDVFGQTGNAIPVSSVEITLPTWTLGLARTFPVWKNRIQISPVLDMVTTFDGKRNTLIRSNTLSMDPRLGIDVGAFSLISVRAGLGNFQKIQNFDGGTDWNYQVNFGLGLRWKAISIDYAITDMGNLSEALYSHVFSLKAAF